MRRRADQVNRKAVVLPLQHVEGLAETQVAQDIHGQPAEPITHALGRRPPFLIADPHSRADPLTKRPDVREDVPLHLLDGGITKRMRHDAALARVQLAVAAVVRVGRGVDKGVVELGLAHVGLEAVDVLEGGRGVEGQGVGAEAHDGAVALVEAPEFEVPVAAVRVPQLVQVGEPCEERARVFCEGVEEEAVGYQACCLIFSSVYRFTIKGM